MTRIEMYESEIEKYHKRIEDLKEQCQEKCKLVKQGNLSLRELNLNKSDYLINEIKFSGFSDRGIMIVIIYFEDGSYLIKNIMNFEEKFD